MHTGTYLSQEISERNRRLIENDYVSLNIYLNPTPCAIEDIVLQANQALHEVGVAFLAPNKTLSPKDLVTLSRNFGSLMAEDAEEIGNWVDEDYVLNVKEDYVDPPSKLLEPFSRRAILVHTENSGSPKHRQPDILMLYCLEASNEDSPTFLFPMSALTNALSERTKYVLSQTYNTTFVEDTPPILTRCSGRDIFSLRDYYPESFRWRCNDNEIPNQDVNSAISMALKEIYLTQCFAAKWTPGALLFLDNKKFLHAKPVNTSSDKILRRHLQRVRIIV